MSLAHGAEGQGWVRSEGGVVPSHLCKPVPTLGSRCPLLPGGQAVSQWLLWK